MAKKYRLRDGVVLTTICEETMLVATRKVREKCNKTVHFDAGAVYLLSLLESGMEESKMIDEISAHFKISKPCAQRNMDSFISKLEGYGCIVAEDCDD